VEAAYAVFCAVSREKREIVYVKRIWKHTDFEKYVTTQIVVFCDNQSTIEISKSAVRHEHSKQIDISNHFTRKLMEKKEIPISYI